MYEIHLRRCFSHTARNNFYYADNLDDVSMYVRAIFALADQLNEPSKLWISIKIVDKPFEYLRYASF